MGRKQTPGLYKRGKIWHVQKQIFGHCLRESTGTELLSEAERYLARRCEEIRQADVYGVRPKRTFEEAATKFLMENQHKRSLCSDASQLRMLNPYIGNLWLGAIHMGSLQSFIEARRKEVSMRTINHGLKVVRRILNLASTEWLDEYGLSWLLTAPKIKLLPEPDLRKPYPLSWEEQDRLFDKLPPHLLQMASFAVNAGCRDQEICNLRWEWEIQVPALGTAKVFIIPADFVKNGEDRLVVCNDIASAVVEAQRAKHPTHVFHYRKRPLAKMLTSAWKRARVKVGIPVRVHDLKHTFGQRLRAAGVSFEDRQDLLGHRSSRITTHYSSAELQNLHRAANKACERNANNVVMLTLLRRPNSSNVRPMEPLPNVEADQGPITHTKPTQCVLVGNGVN